MKTKQFEYFANHGDEDGNNCFTVCYGDPGDLDEIILGTEDNEEDAIEVCKRLNAIATSREAELKKEVDELRASKKLWTRINEGISEANKEIGCGDDYPVTKHAYESEISSLRQALSEREKEVEELDQVVENLEISCERAYGTIERLMDLLIKSEPIIPDGFPVVDQIRMEISKYDNVDSHEDIINRRFDQLTRLKELVEKCRDKFETIRMCWEIKYKEDGPTDVPQLLSEIDETLNPKKDEL